MDHAGFEALVDYIDPEPQRAPSRALEPPSISGLEQSVIHLSRNDPVASIPDLRGWRVGVERLFGASPAGPLANERLEELRRFAILVRVHNDPGDDALDRFLDAGYTVEQAGLVHRIVREDRPVGPHQRFGFEFCVVPLLLATGIPVLMQDVAGDISITLITGAFISVTISSLAYRRCDRLRRVPLIAGNDAPGNRRSREQQV